MSDNSPSNQKAELESPMPRLSQLDRRALLLVLVLVSIGLLIVGCHNRSTGSSSSTTDNNLKWDQGQWDAAKWG